MHILTLLFVSTFGLVALAETSVPSDFKTDYCTNYPEGPKEDPSAWKHCCLKHDMYFWAGGSKQDRYDADLELKNCIVDAGYPRQARIMYSAVRMGSYSPVKYPDRRWGNGWKNRAEFKALSLEEIQSIKAELDSGYKYISDDLKSTFISDLLKRKN